MLPTKPYFIKFFTLVIFACLLFYTTSTNAQCAFGGTNSGVTVTPTATSQFTPNIQAGRYFMMNVVNGGTYTVSTCGLTSWDTQLTVYSSGGTYIAYNDDTGGCGYRSQVSFSPTFTGQVRVILHQYNCTSSSNTSQVEYFGTVPNPIINIDDVTVDENAGTANFTVTHTGANASGAFTVNYQTNAGTATAGTDYTTNSGTLNFNGSNGDTETIAVSILDDPLIESVEDFTISFTGTSDAAVDITDTAMGSIVDDDSLIITDGVTENTCNDLFVDSGGLSGNYSNNEDITFTICPDTANMLTNVDFSNFDVQIGDLLYVYEGTTTGGTLIGQYDNTNVPGMIESTDASGCLTFRFTSNGSGTGNGWEANVQCFSDGPKIIIDDVSVDEDAGFAIFNVRHVRNAHTFFGFPVPFTVDYQTLDGSAIAGSDYTSSTGTLTFTGAVGNVQTISVPITLDAIAEADETFTVEFTAENAWLATVNISDTATGTINSQIAANVPLALFQQFDGYYDYSSTGGTLRTQSNSGDYCAITTSSSNTLISSIPSTATIERAYLYWAHSSNVRDETITFETQTVTANYVYQTVLNSGGVSRNFYGYVSDVTSIIQGIGNPSTNTYDFSGLTIDNTGNYCSTATVLGGWTLMVFYEDSGLPAVNINLYQGFDGLSNSGTSFTLDSFYAIAGSGAKASFLSWEGDPNLDGSSSGSTNPEELSITNQSSTNYVLSNDGGQSGNNAYNSTMYDNTVSPIYNVSNTYGVDWDTYDIASYISTGDSQVTANVDVGQDFVISAAVVIKVPSNLITGTVYEDVNYPGGAGRDMATSGGVGVFNATVELFDSSGNFVQRVSTDATGSYSFGGMVDGTYSIKVVNSTVRSTRGGGGSCSSCYPVQTFRRFGSAGSLTDVTNEIGGTTPSAVQDVTLGILTGAQSVSQVTVASNGVVGIDFGFNFNTIVNTNETGQGSLRQYVINANALAETGMDIEANGIFDPTAGNDVSIFMIPPSGDPLGRTADSNYASGYFNIFQNSNQLPIITDNDTHIDGRTQTAYSGNSNSGTVGAGGSNVGVSATALPNYDLPEIQVHRDAGDVFRIQGGGIIIRNISVYANNNAGVRVESGSVTISNNLLGVNAAGANAGNIDSGVVIIGGAVTIDRNYIATNSVQGIRINGGTSSLIQNNHIYDNGNSACNDNIRIQNGSGIVIQQNLIENASSFGIEMEGSLGNITIDENTISNSGQHGGDCGLAPENAGLLITGNNSTITNNVIASNGGSGIILTGTSSGNLISQNSIYANGTATPSLGIDINDDGVTLNDTGDIDGGPNGAINFPVLEAAYKSGSNIVVTGWSRPGATIEFFLTDINQGSAAAGDNQLGMSTDYGEGQVFLASMVEGSGSDSDSNTSSYTDNDGNTDNTNEFRFTIAVPPTVVIGDDITATATISNSTSEFSPFSKLKAYSIITNRRITYRVKKD